MSHSHRLLAHHGRPCPYCNEQMIIRLKGRRKASDPHFPTRDHVVPKALMPSMGTLIVCRKCNNDKGAHMLSAWAELLSRRGDPRAPIVKEFMRKEWYRQMFPRAKVIDDFVRQGYIEVSL